MNDMSSERLGFSDLNEDESYLIVLYRDWQRRGPTRAVSEHAIARLVQDDKVYPALGAVLGAFDAVGHSGDGVASGLLLSQTEEQLLTDLAQMFGPQPGKLVPLKSEMQVRPATQISRSGYDRRQGAAEKAYWRAALSQVLQQESPE